MIDLVTFLFKEPTHIVYFTTSWISSYNAALLFFTYF